MVHKIGWNMQKFAIVVHGGAGQDSDFIRKNIDGYKKGLREAAGAGFILLKNGGTAIDAVEVAVNKLEDHPLFNAGKGSALNEKGEVEMDASIMDGKNRNAGAVCIVRNVKHPVSLAKIILEKSKHTYVGSMGALKFAKEYGLKLMPDAYFVTEHAYQQYADARAEEGKSLELKTHGTVGCVALDQFGNIAAATSTGGTENKSEGRIGDTSIIGTGTFAYNKTCAISCTGDGEYIIENVVAFQLSAIMKYKRLGLKEASDFLMQEELKNTSGDIGFIAIDVNGNFTMKFNSTRMHRAWMSSNGEEGVSIYND
ncbi:MAG: isoaspartyl peptidase/L-asparaginase family protein [Flavisolibacter sp.]